MNEPESTSEREQLDQRLDEYIDGSLTLAEAAEVDKRLEASAELRAEHDELLKLHQLLVEVQAPVRDGFADQVMAALPAAPWRKPVAQPWPLAVGLLVALAASGLLLVGLGQGGVGVAGLGLLATLGQFFATTAVAGAGLLGASWRGIGMAVDSWLTASLPNMVISAFLVVGLNVLLFRLLRGRHAAARQSVRSDD